MDVNMTWMLTTSDYNASYINDTTSTAYTNTTSVPNIDFTTISQVTINTTSNGSSIINNPKKSIATIDFTILITYFVIALVGVIGNILVIVAILCLPRLRTAHNVYVVNLCIADSLLGINAFILAADTWDQNWAPENGFCGFFSFISTFPPIAVVGSMLCIASNRHFAIVRATGNTIARQRQSALVYSAVVWSIAMILTLPVLVGWVTSRAGLFCACCVYFIENVIYSTVLTVCIYLLPNIIIMFLYARIFLHVRQSRMRVLEHHQQISAERSSVMNYPGTLRKSNSFHLTSDLRVIVQFLVLFLVFNLCYFPATFVFWKVSEDPNLAQGARGAVTILFAINILANPICYFILNTRARAEVCKALTCRHHLPRHSITHPRDDVSSEDGQSKSRPKSTTQRVTRSCELTTTYKSPGAMRPPSGHSLRTVSELNLPDSPNNIMSGRDGSVTSHQRSPDVTAVCSAGDNANIVGCGDLGNGVAVGHDASSTVGAGTWLQNEPGSDDAANALQVAAGCRKLPLIRRAESLHVNIIGSDQYI